LDGERDDLAVHPGREGDEHADHGSQSTSLRNARDAPGQKWAEVCMDWVVGSC
jgi:hypothetical protein